MSTTGGAPGNTAEFPQRAAILRAAIGLGLYAATFGASFGAVAISSGLSVAQAMLLSLVMFTGASQFAFVGVVATGGSPWAAVAAALLLGVRNAFYGVPISEFLAPRGWGRLWTAHFVIDETTAMTLGQATPRARRYAFWATGLILCALWQVGSLAGALVGGAIDPAAFGLDAAAPAVFLALLWPNLRSTEARLVAVGGVLVALALVPITPPGIPVVAAAGVAVIAGLIRDRTEPTPTSTSAAKDNCDESAEGDR
jgi:4-azaleucine resistance transporter AzlC